jgi:anti-anti-sigma factor
MTAIAVFPAAARVDQLRFATEWPNPSQVRIAVQGEIDACNAQELVDYVFRRAANCRHLVLDMEGVEFFSTAGFARLRTIEVRCLRAQVEWTLIPSRAVSRVLDICDPRRSLPVEAG